MNYPSNYTRYKSCGEITSALPNLNGCAGEVLEYIKFLPTL